MLVPPNLYHIIIIIIYIYKWESHELYIYIEITFSSWLIKLKSQHE